MASSTLSRVSLPFFLLALVALGSSCATTHSSVTTQTDGWLDPSPGLKRRIDDEALRIPYTHGVERIELIRWFATVGEPAYPKLLELAGDPRKDVAIAALAALGATRDSRLVAPLEKVEIPDGPDAVDLRLERARTLLRLGDWGAVPPLITGLRDERMFTRALCSQALTEATKESFGFDPKVEPAQSAEAVAQWEAWWKARSADKLLAKPVEPPRKNTED
jgi:HEAT repeat protein